MHVVVVDVVCQEDRARAARSRGRQVSYQTFLSLCLILAAAFFIFCPRVPVGVRAHDDRRQNLITEITPTEKPSVIWYDEGGFRLCRRTDDG